MSKYHLCSLCGELLHEEDLHGEGDDGLVRWVCRDEESCARVQREGSMSERTEPSEAKKGTTMTDSQKHWIDNASYKQLLSRWRFAPLGDAMFQGDVGDYYAKVLNERRDADPQGHTAASKEIGW